MTSYCKRATEIRTNWRKLKGALTMARPSQSPLKPVHHSEAHHQLVDRALQEPAVIFLSIALGMDYGDAASDICNNSLGPTATAAQPEVLESRRLAPY